MDRSDRSHERGSAMASAGLALLALVSALAALAALAPTPALAAAGQCAMIVPEGPREVMINTCDTCRSIEILRKRPGNDVPVQRTFTLPPGSRLQVPFLGPGRSRITAEIPCKGEAGAPENLVDRPEKASHKGVETCVSLERAKHGGVTLVNRCGGCRAALIERKNAATEAGQREAFKLDAKSVRGLDSDGFALVGLIGDIACP